MSTDTVPQLEIPKSLLPSDGRFGSGPSKVRPEALSALAATGRTYLGTSHRRPGVRSVVKRLRQGVGELFSLPDGYMVALGNGGATTFWDMASFALIEARSQHCSFGEFSSKFASVVKAAPHLGEPEVMSSDPGTHPDPVARADVDAYALTHCETSTGVAMGVRRPEGASGLVLVDATSAAGGLEVDMADTDAYYFSPQKCFASEGGLWLAILSPAAQERARRLIGGGRWVPTSLDLVVAMDNSAQDQTYNTPSLATLLLMVDQVEHVLANGGLPWAVQRCTRSSEHLYGWAEKSDFASPFVAEPDQRSKVVGTIDFDRSVDAAKVASILRANGVVDTEPYRKLGRNQLRIAMFPAIEPDDVAALCNCIDHIVSNI